MDRSFTMSHCMRRLYILGFALGAVGILTGCEDLNSAVDGLLGREAPVISAAGSSRDLLVPVKKRAPGQSPAPQQQAAPAGAEPAAKPAPAPKQQTAQGPEGKRRTAGVGKSPETLAELAKKRRRTAFDIPRDPFRSPTEVLPSDCPPSVPLCRFDRSQLKLVGIVQVDGGRFKGMVEDPDGRGYFVGPGMQIGGATVTQVSNKGLTLHVHKSRQDVMIPLFKEPKQGEEF